MQINVTFNSLEEMQEFIDKVYLAGGKVQEVAASVPMAQKAPEIPVEPQPVAPAQTAVPVQTAPIVAETPVQPAMPTVVPTTTPAYTLDDLARAGMTLMDSGRQNDLRGLLQRFGVDALPALPKEQYGAFATALREMGAQI